jgi:hypothetical protein
MFSLGLFCASCALFLVQMYGNIICEWQADVYPWGLHYISRNCKLRVNIAGIDKPLGLSVSILYHKPMWLLFNMMTHLSCTSCLTVVPCVRSHIRHTKMFVAANFTTIFSDGRYLSPWNGSYCCITPIRSAICNFCAAELLMIIRVCSLCTFPLPEIVLVI